MISDAYQLRRLAAALAPLGLAVLLAACGSTRPAKTGSGLTSQPGYAPALAFDRCMRSNGVPNFPDSRTGGIRIQGSGQTLSINGISVNAPAFLAARARCRRYLPHAQVSQSQIAYQRRKGLEFARCMRSHGVPNFPDPKVTPGTNGNNVVDLRGVGLNFQSPAFKSAAQACGGGPKGPL